MLVTHEHVDHVDVLRCCVRAVPVLAPAGATISGLTLVDIRPGEEPEVAGFRVEAVGGRHAAVLEGQETCATLGYVIDGPLYRDEDVAATMFLRRGVSGVPQLTSTRWS